MPKFTIESTYLLPVYRHRAYEAETFEEACRKAVEDDDWQGAKEDYESSGATYLTGAWAGEDSAYMGEAIPIPPAMANEHNDVLAALRLFVSECGGSPPDWLREGYAAAENAIAKADVR